MAVIVTSANRDSGEDSAASRQLSAWVILVQQIKAGNMRLLSIITLILCVTFIGCPNTESTEDDSIATIPASWPVSASIFPPGSTKAKLPETWADLSVDGYIVNGKSRYPLPYTFFVAGFKCDLSYMEVEKHIGEVLLSAGFAEPATYENATGTVWGKEIFDDQLMTLLLGGDQTLCEYIVVITIADREHFYEGHQG
jgi:hypothetical protein